MAEGSHVASRFVRVPNKLCRGPARLSSVLGLACLPAPYGVTTTLREIFAPPASATAR